MIRIGLKALLKERGISQRELSRRIGRHPDVVSRFARGDTGGVTYDLLDLICNELECTPGALLCYDRPDEQIGLFSAQSQSLPLQIREEGSGFPDSESGTVPSAADGRRSGQP